MAEHQGAPPKGASLTVGGLGIHYHDYGSGNAKGPVVFIHGSGPGASGYSNFKGNVEAFTNAGYRALVPDLPGFGYSDKPTDRDYTTTFFAESLLGLLQGLGVERSVLIGNSLGGAVALRAALDRPEAVGKLVLMAPGGLEELPTYMAMPAMKKMVEQFVGGALDKEGLQAILANLVFDASLVTEELVAERFAILQQQPPEVLARMSIPNMEAELSLVQCPVLAFWGANDQLLPPSGGQKLLQGCRPCRLIVVSDCGHWVMVEHRRMFNAACLDFLENG